MVLRFEGCRAETGTVTATAASQRTEHPTCGNLPPAGLIAATRQDRFVNLEAQGLQRAAAFKPH